VRYPLFILLRLAKKRKAVPDDIAHSGILTLEYLRKQGRDFVVWAWEKPIGTDFIDEIADRATRGRILRRWEFVAIRWRIAKTVYAGAPLSNYERNHCHPYNNRCGGDIGGLRFGGEWVGQRPWSRIEIHDTPKKPCRWCAKPVYFRPAWVDPYDKSVRCNGRDCRRMDYLRLTPQSRGGIDLTPNQRKALDRKAWDTQRAINYFNLITKEIKHGRRTNHGLR